MSATQTRFSELASALGDPELMLRRIKADDGQDAKLLEAGDRLKEVILWCKGRELLIEQKVIVSDLARVELERSIPAQGISFLPIVDLQAEPVHGI